MTMKLPLNVYLAEMACTGILVFVGLSFVIMDFGKGSGVATLIHDTGLRRLITGFLFGSTGAAIAVSPIGKESGAHINPAVTLAFYLKKKISGSHAIGYVVSQLIGAILGALPLVLWGQVGSSVDFGVTEPGKHYGALQAFIGETITTFALITGLFFFLSHKKIQRFTPLLFPVLYALMVYIEAPVSGTSTNPARSLGPSVLSGNWHGWWIYWLGPLAGTLFAIGIHKLPLLNRFEIAVAKIYHFDHDPYKIFHFTGPEKIKKQKK